MQNSNVHFSSIECYDVLSIREPIREILIKTFTYFFSHKIEQYHHCTMVNSDIYTNVPKVTGRQYAVGKVVGATVIDISMPRSIYFVL